MYVDGLDYFGVPFNLTFVKATTQTANISIVDDDLVENLEEIYLLLTPLTSGMISVDPNSALILITDDDGEIINPPIFIILILY